jgi:hypothetical protein
MSDPDPDKTQELPAYAPEKRKGWNPTPTNPKTPRRYSKTSSPLTRPAFQSPCAGEDRLKHNPQNRKSQLDAVELPARSSSAQDDALEAWFRAGMLFFVVVVVPLLLAWKWGE